MTNRSAMDLCMKYEATYATTWSMFENSGNRKGTDFSFIDGKNMTPRPSYRHIEMIANNFEGYYLEVMVFQFFVKEKYSF